MLRNLIVASAALAMLSGVALADSVTTVRESDHGKVVTKRFTNDQGQVVTKRKVVRNGIAGSSVSRSHTVTDPATGASSTTTITRNGE